SGSSGELRQGYKFQMMEWLRPILDQWLASGRDYVLCGDWNIVRSRLDIRNWTSNQKNSGCLPEERDWLNGLCADREEEADVAAGRGWVDAYRVLHPEGQDYTWWSNRGAARANNVGWRTDYQFVTPALGPPPALRPRARPPAVHREQRFSPHAPSLVDSDGPLACAAPANVPPTRAGPASAAPSARPRRSPWRCWASAAACHSCRSPR